MKSFRFVTPALATTLGIDGFTCFARRFASLSVAATVLVGIFLTPSRSFACEGRINLAAVEQELAKPSLSADLHREANAIKNKAASAIQAGRREGVTYISSTWLCWAFQHLRGAFDVSMTVVHSIALRQRQIKCAGLHPISETR